MAGTPIDMHLPETFHRLKRTVLLFSAVLVLLAIGKPESNQEIHLALTDIKVPLTMFKMLVWLGGIYYFVGFLFEARTAHQINTEIMRGVDLAGFRDALAARATDLERYHGEFQGAQQVFVRMREHLFYVLQFLEKVSPDEIKKGLLMNRTELNDRPHHELGVSTMEQLLVESFNGNLRQTQQLLQSSNAGVNEEQFSYLSDVMTGLTKELQETHKQMTTLSARIVGARSLSFWFWEIGGAAVAFAIATGFVFVPMAAHAMKTAEVKVAADVSASGKSAVESPSKVPQAPASCGSASSCRPDSRPETHKLTVTPKS